MHLLDLFESTMEGYTVTRGIDKDRYQERAGLEGPFQTKSGKVVYYDAKQGQYYDPDTDRYIDYDDYRALDEDPTQEEPVSDTMRKQPAQQIDVYEQQVDEGAREFVTGALLAGLLGLGVQQLGSISDAKNSPLGRAMAQAAEQGDQYAAKHLEKLDFYFDANDTGSIKVLSKKYLGRVVEGVVSEAEVATTQKTQRMVNLMRARYPEAKTDLEALLLHFNTGQRQDRQDISTLYTQNDQEEQEIDQLQAALDKLKSRAKMGIATEAADSDRQRALDASMAELEKQFGPLKKVKYAAPSEEELRAKATKARAQQAERSKQRMERAQQLIRKYGVKIEPGHEGYFLKGVSDGRGGVEDRRAGDAYGPYVGAYDAGVSVGRKMRSTTNEDYYETDEQRELARLGRIIMDIGAKRDDAVGVAMGAVGMELTKYGTPQGVSNIRKLEQVTGQPESVIMKMMALAQKVKGDVAVGDETAGNDEDEVKEALRKVPYAGYKGPGSDFRAYDEPDQRSNWVVKVGGKKWKVFANEKTARKAAYTVQQKYSKETEVYATMDPVSEGAAKDFDDNFSKYIGYTLGGGEPAKMLQKQVAQRQADNPDAGTGLGPSVLNIPKAREKAAKRGIKAPGNLRASPNTRDPKRLPEGWAESPMVSASIPNNTSDTAARLQRLAKENGVEYARQGRTVTLTGPRMNVRNIFFKMAYAPGNHPEMVPVTEGLDHDIRIGDTVETKKMGQMQGVVTGFSTKTGDTRVMFKHKSGKVYATPASNLKVIDTVKKTESLDDTVVEAKKKPVPTNPELWSRAKAAAKQKYDVYPSAYANAFASKWYKEKGGGWRMGNPKK